MEIKIGINGFGRIGRCVFRLIQKQFPDIKILAINDLLSVDNLVYLLKYDTVHGLLKEEIVPSGQGFTFNGESVVVTHEKEPCKIDWKGLGVDYVIESTGFFTHSSLAAGHLEGGAKRVIVSAPGKGEMPTFVMGVNHQNYNPKTDSVVSNASCTTNCLAPVVKVLLDHFGIDEGLMTTVHAMTATQMVQDSPSKKDLRGGRAASVNIIPSSTGAAKAVALCLPQIKGKLTGMAFRVPTMDVSVVDLTVKLTKSTSYDIICDVMKSEAGSGMKNILDYTEEPVVSSDFIGNTHSAIFDRHAGIALNEHFFKLVAWYDNEMGYASRLLDLITYMDSKG
ncbi:type I glyceraldehyde-3-phosphate dehydrogenase [Candidatus Aerophobetes bacterium]|uniref:Glyceraldehyde-3-phosphate dehydrogenase n=1 Tax=Aerophobetes bacterium TaxID=2030807 RepID=A0A2A4X7C4_UNCAE|nr:MAG: type I glyceraldehyde-3-phosphate dehydrogenase [Candidatus Aerophobetes bacterium]